MAMALDVKISFSWTNYCRLCLLDNGIMLPLFEEEGQNRQLGQKIEACLQLVTYDGDPLPRRICHKCLYKINQTYEFRTMALESYERLKSHLLPLKHVPEVRQYLEKANCLQKHIDFDAVNLAPCSTPTISVRDDVARSNQSLIRIKSERDLMEDQTISPWSSASVSTDEDTPFLSTTYSSSPLTSPNIQAAESTTTSDNQSATWSVKHEPLKRKRYPAADIRTSVGEPLSQADSPRLDYHRLMDGALDESFSRTPGTENGSLMSLSIAERLGLNMPRGSLVGGAGGQGSHPHGQEVLRSAAPLYMGSPTRPPFSVRASLTAAGFCSAGCVPRTPGGGGRVVNYEDSSTLAFVFGSDSESEGEVCTSPWSPDGVL